MTKTKLRETEKSQQPRCGPEYTAIPMVANDRQQEPVPAGTTCWYVFGILSTICCCLPCGVIGLVHAMIAKHEGERGNYGAHRIRMRQAKCWISWSIILGLLVVLAMIAWHMAFIFGFGRGICGNGPWMYSYWNETESWNDTSIVDEDVIFN